MYLHLETSRRYHHYQEEYRLLRLNLQTHLLKQLGRGNQWTWTQLLCQVIRIMNLSEPNSPNSLDGQNPYHRRGSSGHFLTISCKTRNVFDYDAKLSKVPQCVSRGSQTTLATTWRTTAPSTSR